MEKKINKNVLRLCESAIMIAVGTVLSMFKMEMPFGGSITVFSMLPVIIIAYRYGTLWGCFTGVVYAIVQMVLGLNNFSYATSFLAVVVIFLFDYFIAFGSMGLGGIFKNKIKNQSISLGAGALIACLVRYLCHFISGITVWASFAGDMPVWLYSLTYNGSYMIPETIVTVVGAVLVGLFLNFSTPTITPMKKAH